jgi:alpha-mannosidase
MRITLMRAPTCPDRTGDHGISTFIYAYYPHKNSWQDAETVKNGLCMNVPVLSAVASKQDGAIKSGTSFLSLSSDNFAVDCIKVAQDGRGVIVRVSEEERRRGKAKLTWKLGGTKVVECNMIEQDETPVEFDGESFEFTYRPFEVKTFRIF